MRTISKEWLAFLREQFPRGSQVICWELDDPEHISTGTLEQIDEEGRFHTRMGDGAIRKLALGEEQFSVQPPEPTLLKLYMPLTADFYGRDEWGDIDETGEEWDGRTLLDYEDQIQGALVRNRMPEEKERGVMRWYDKQDSLNIPSSPTSMTSSRTHTSTTTGRKTRYTPKNCCGRSCWASTPCAGGQRASSSTGRQISPASVSWSSA